MPMVGTGGAATRNTTRFSKLAPGDCQDETNCLVPAARREEFALFLGEISLGFGEFGAVRACAADFGQLGIKRLRSTGIAGGLRGTSGTYQPLKAIRRILQDGFGFGERFGRALEFHEQ